MFCYDTVDHGRAELEAAGFRVTGITMLATGSVLYATEPPTPIPARSTLSIWRNCAGGAEATVAGRLIRAASVPELARLLAELPLIDRCSLIGNGALHMATDAYTGLTAGGIDDVTAIAALDQLISALASVPQ